MAREFSSPLARLVINTARNRHFRVSLPRLTRKVRAESNNPDIDEDDIAHFVTRSRRYRRMYLYVRLREALKELHSNPGTRSLEKLSRLSKVPQQQIRRLRFAAAVGLSVEDVAEQEGLPVSSVELFGLLDASEGIALIRRFLYDCLSQGVQSDDIAWALNGKRILQLEDSSSKYVEVIFDVYEYWHLLVERLLQNTSAATAKSERKARASKHQELTTHLMLGAGSPSTGSNFSSPPFPKSKCAAVADAVLDGKDFLEIAEVVVEEVLAEYRACLDATREHLLVRGPEGPLPEVANLSGFDLSATVPSDSSQVIARLGDETVHMIDEFTATLELVGGRARAEFLLKDAERGFPGTPIGTRKRRVVSNPVVETLPGVPSDENLSGYSRFLFDSGGLAVLLNGIALSPGMEARGATF